jgi:hypothetical protein
MGYILIYRDAETGMVTYLDKVFPSPEEAYQSAKVHSIHDYEIVSETEFQEFMAEQQAQAQQQQSQPRYRGGYQQHVEAYSDEREPEREPRRPIPVMLKNYRPQFISFQRKVRR